MTVGRMPTREEMGMTATPGSVQRNLGQPRPADPLPLVDPTALVGIDGARTDAYGRLVLDPPVVEAAQRRAFDAVDRATPGIPAFVSHAGWPHGELPPGIHVATLDEVRARFGNSPRRLEILDQLSRSASMLHNSTSAVLLGGSFVSSKAAPGDLDVAVLMREGSTLERLKAILNVAVHPVDVHLYDATTFAEADAKGATLGENMLELFQHTRTGMPHGVVLLRPDSSAVVDAARAARAVLTH